MVGFRGWSSHLARGVASGIMAAALWGGATQALAAGISVSLGSGSALTGAEAKLRVSGSDGAFLAADLTVRFDTDFLKLLRVDEADFELLPTSVPTVVGPSFVDVLLSVVPVNPPGFGTDYFDLVFKVLASSGSSVVEIVGGLDPSPSMFFFEDPNGQEFEVPVSDNIPGTVTVLQSVPIANTAALALLALAALARQTRRRARLGCASATVSSAG